MSSAARKRRQTREWSEAKVICAWLAEHRDRLLAAPFGDAVAEVRAVIKRGLSGRYPAECMTECWLVETPRTPPGERSDLGMFAILTAALEQRDFPPFLRYGPKPAQFSD